MLLHLIFWRLPCRTLPPAANDQITAWWQDSPPNPWLSSRGLTAAQAGVTTWMPSSLESPLACTCPPCRKPSGEPSFHSPLIWPSKMSCSRCHKLLTLGVLPAPRELNWPTQAASIDVLAAGAAMGSYWLSAPCRPARSHAQQGVPPCWGLKKLLKSTCPAHLQEGNLTAHTAAHLSQQQATQRTQNPITCASHPQSASSVQCRKPCGRLRQPALRTAQ